MQKNDFTTSPSTYTPVHTKFWGSTLILLFLANFVNFFDRAIPAVVAQPIKMEFGLSDAQLGLIGSAFTVIYALVGLPLGRLSDVRNRPKIMAAGLFVWSMFTAFSGLAGSFLTFMLARLGVGVGEASFAPAASSLIGDLYDSRRRSRALGIFMLGIPVGLMAAYFTVGAIAEAAGDWRAPFLVAAVPGVLLTLWMLRTREVVRGGAEDTPPPSTTEAPPVGRIRILLASRTLRWLIAAGVAYNFASYSVNAFTVPLLQRQFGMSLTGAAGAAGVVIGITGLVGLLAGGAIADRLRARSPRARLMLGAVASILAVPLTFWGLASTDSGAFVALFAGGWLLAYASLVTVYPALHDVIVPRLRASAIAIYFAALYLTGGFAGPLVVGAISDAVTENRVEKFGGTIAEHAGAGLNTAMFAIPVALVITALCTALAARHVNEESSRMQASLRGEDHTRASTS